MYLCSHGTCARVLCIFLFSVTTAAYSPRGPKFGAPHPLASWRNKLTRTPQPALDEEGLLPFAEELSVARHAVEGTGELLLELKSLDPADARRHASQQLSFEFSTEACACMGQWAFHTDATLVAACLLRDAKPVLAVVSCLASKETTFAVRGGGAFVQRSDGVVSPARVGFASPFANVVALSPLRTCKELDSAISSLEHKMPIRVAPVDTCAEGLIQVALGRADVLISAPQRFCAQPPKPLPALPVLCAVQMLLEESGGCLSDLRGEALDFRPLSRGRRAARLGRRVSSDEGVVASADEASHNFFLSTIQSSFSARAESFVDFGATAEKLRSFSQKFRLEIDRGDQE
mmetsp:Transcript_7959/g.17531  ORF Transcript_7959/g.17531 Transcript_7959/m.17531 type:complete len:347 (+) Transcript_7959:141-1181(+)